MQENKLTSIGKIIKKESLISVDFQQKCNSLVLESSRPFPGYHGIILPADKPLSLYLVLKSNRTDEEIIRAIQKIKKEKEFVSFDGAPGNIEINRKNETVIRIKDAEYADIPKLLDMFKDIGFRFAKYREMKAFDTLINIRKYFKIKYIEEGIYSDLTEENFNYIRIPFLPDWEMFESITKKIKYNIEDNNFDAALCSIYYDKGLMDFVRIFDENFDKNKITFIKNKYLDELSKL